jgi:acetylornithine deacetylase/succinyl-diaminopimelate desuccinylase-like protein
MWMALAFMGALAARGGARDDADAIAARLLDRPEVAALVKSLVATEPAVIDEQIRLCEIPAPPFKEGARAEAYRHAFEAIGLKNVRIDRVGNVLGERPGRRARPHVVFSAHLDTVFPEGTDVAVTRNGPVLKGPGISDDCRGLAVVLAVARALDAAKIQTAGTVTFVGTVGEEGLGDLRGVKHLFDTELKGRVDRFVSVDGAGLGITHVGVGSRRYRVTFRGSGGHSYGDFGLANPIHALGRALAAVASLQVPSTPKTTFNVGRVGGGTSINSIAFEAWMEVDLRSADSGALAALEAKVTAAVDAAAASENARSNRPDQVTVERTLVGNRSAGSTAVESEIVRAAVSVTRAMGLPVALGEGSTDSNVPMGLGVPAITIDGGGSGHRSHSLNETFDPRDSWKGTQRAFLLCLALAELP